MAHKVELFHWNPKRTLVKRGRLAKYTRIPLRINNFGDLIGPLVVRAMLQRLGLHEDAATRSCQLLSVGSVLHFAHTGDVVWGTGRNGKVPEQHHVFRDLDVRAVRGPLTREYLLGKGIAAPEVYGDPALLLPSLMPSLRNAAAVKRRAVTIVPNLNDMGAYPRDERMLDPRAPLRTCLETIASSELVVGSSLHGIIVAEALGIPARAVESHAESPFKYLDHYLGTGRDGYQPAGTVEEAIAAGGEPLPDGSGLPDLVRAFPADLWGRSSVDAEAVLSGS